MKMGKRTTALCVAAIGAVVFSTTALADVAIGSGYNNLKDAAKTTMAKLTNEVDSFTANISISAKIDDREFETGDSTAKYDMVNHKRSSVSTSSRNEEATEDYSFEDEEKYVYKSADDEKYYVSIKTDDSSDNSALLENPFEDEMAADAEAVLDAFVGNLKEIIQVEESDGQKMYIGNISETQVPTLVNALTSFAFKYSSMNEYTYREYDLPHLVSDIYVQGASGKAIENEDGILENVIATGSLVGKDENGAEHTFSVDLAFSLTDIDSTVVEEPALDDSNTIYSEASSYAFTEDFVGTYRKDILKSEGGSVTKVGESVLEITSVVDGVVTGTYSETYVEGYTPENPMNFSFVAEPTERGFDNIFTITDENGETVTGLIMSSGMYGQNIRIELGVEMSEDGNSYYYSGNYENFNDELIREFD